MVSALAWRLRVAAKSSTVVAQKAASACPPDKARFRPPIRHTSIEQRQVVRRTGAEFGKDKRLLTAQDYSRVFSAPDARSSHRNLLLLAKANEQGKHRIGLVIAKKHVRLATDRNRLKRQAREFFRQQPDHVTGMDVVLIARGGLGDLDKTQVSSILQKQWHKLLSQCDCKQP